MEKNISIITNFGCYSNCWYDVWKNHPLKDVNEPTDWKKLKQFLEENKDKGKFSVSGGGDCLYNYNDHYIWWKNLFRLANELGLKVDVHSRERLWLTFFWKKVNKCVFSSDDPFENKVYLNWIRKLTKLRITHVVTKDTTDEMIEEYLRFQKAINCQFTIKQLVGFNDNNRYNEIREKYPEIFYLNSGDYNVYFMPDNSIQEKFL